MQFMRCLAHTWAETGSLLEWMCKFRLHSTTFGWNWSVVPTPIPLLYLELELSVLIEVRIGVEPNPVHSFEIFLIPSDLLFLKLPFAVRPGLTGSREFTFT